MSKAIEYCIMYNGRLLEPESLLDIRTELTDDEWEGLIEETICAYSYFKGIDLAYSIEGGLEPNDRRIMRRIKRTIISIQKLDPIIIAKFNIDELIEAYKKVATEQLQSFRKPVKVSTGKYTNEDADIHANNIRVSSL